MYIQYESLLAELETLAKENEIESTKQVEPESNVIDLYTGKRIYK